ncbi:class III extradiol dioxygenase family protein [Arthrobacter sp. zg-Y1219]|uniref:class III extradiol dioxygenase family protein n=1 Tax=Arthrobacter sp. zg-Y1219 TaxID=3049067 RepID=UPI0024C35CFF|nr:class III extradiol dioxygenase family protein [Arthrobacter sp. zg-Y1219]MDK1361698.1 class III extradiol dioxygenase family protein [Arthrobacter sp. zg-Y1219]
MAEIVAGIGISHVPALGPAVEAAARGTDTNPGMKAFTEVGEWLADTRPDVVVMVYNDHGASFSFDLVPTFAIGAAEFYRPADEGFGRPPIAEYPGAADLSWHIVDQVVNDGFDLTVCQSLDVDHGFSTPMKVLFGAPANWPVKVIPLAVNVVQQPTPTARRCYDLGQAIGRAIASYPDDVRVAVVGTGGMSHQLQGERAGHINPDFDRQFLREIVEDPGNLASLSNPEYIHLAGSEGAELVMWLIMRGAMDEDVKQALSGYVVPVANTAAGVVAMQNLA